MNIHRNTGGKARTVTLNGRGVEIWIEQGFWLEDAIELTTAVIEYIEEMTTSALANEKFGITYVYNMGETMQSVSISAAMGTMRDLVRLQKKGLLDQVNVVVPNKIVAFLASAGEIATGLDLHIAKSRRAALEKMATDLGDELLTNEEIDAQDK
jgi:hypothetical protein